MTVRLYQFAPCFGLPNGSPFCMKVEGYLRLARIDYRCENGAMPFRAPRRKLPWIDDGGTVVADSSFIVDHLEATVGATTLEGWEFLLGDRVSSYDAVALALLANLLWVPVDSPVRAHALRSPALAEYCDRMMAKVFPEYRKP